MKMTNIFDQLEKFFETHIMKPHHDNLRKLEGSLSSKNDTFGKLHSLDATMDEMEKKNLKDPFGQ